MQVSNNICIHIYTINAVSFYHLWYDAIYTSKRQYTDKTLTLRKCMYMRASGGSKLRKISAFLHSKTAISFNILLVLQILLSQKHIFFRCQITSAYIMQSMQFPFIIHGLDWLVLYINDSIPTKH